MLSWKPCFVCYKEVKLYTLSHSCTPDFSDYKSSKTTTITHCDNYCEGKGMLWNYKKCPIQIREEEGTGALAKLSQPGRSCSFEEAHLTLSPGTHSQQHQSPDLWLSSSVPKTHLLLLPLMSYFFGSCIPCFPGPLIPTVPMLHWVGIKHCRETSSHSITRWFNKMLNSHKIFVIFYNKLATHHIYIGLCHTSVCSSVLCLVTTKIWSDGH